MSVGSSAKPIVRIEGRAVAVRGDNIDTDRIIPARFLRCVTFDGLGDHAFEDDRAGLRAKGEVHPFDDPRHQGAAILAVNRNFASGSSREHAPQSLRSWGIRAIVGESFAEIFFGNCQSLGIPCLVAERGDVEAFMRWSEARKAIIDVADAVVTFGDRRFPARIPPGPRVAFVRGTWDVLGLLLDDRGQVAETAARLPYLRGF
jgi:3-isopropylmalate/(R)-2-methylmalate dehydratase small subunit